MMIQNHVYPLQDLCALSWITMFYFRNSVHDPMRSGSESLYFLDPHSAHEHSSLPLIAPPQDVPEPSWLLATVPQPCSAAHCPPTALLPRTR